MQMSDADVRASQLPAAGVQYNTQVYPVAARRRWWCRVRLGTPEPVPRWRPVPLGRHAPLHGERPGQGAPCCGRQGRPCVGTLS